MPYFNFRGDPMPESAAPASTVYGSAAGGETLTAPAGPSAVDSGGGPNDLLIGSSGDNVFYVRHGGDVVQVGGGLAGVKTIVAYHALQPADQCAEPRDCGSHNYAVGNALPNIIRATSGPAQLYGGPGDDVLVGAGGGSSFITPVGQGSDVVYGFTPTDTLRLVARPSAHSPTCKARCASPAPTRWCRSHPQRR